MSTLLPILFFGFFLGMRHATDSDHVIAVTTIVSRQRRIWSAAWTGIFWGIGHSLTLLVIGGAIILFGVIAPVRLGMSLEFSVALMLIPLGALNLHSTYHRVGEVNIDHADVHRHSHRHGDYLHSHTHGQEDGAHGHDGDDMPPAKLDRVFGRSRIYQALRPVVIGIVHGLAGLSGRHVTCPSDHSRSGLGNGLSYDLWRRHNRRDDANHRRDRGAGFVLDPVSISASPSWNGRRRAQP